MKRIQYSSLLLLPFIACVDSNPEGLMPSTPAKTTVEMDFYNRPLPSIPLPNDVATRYDPTSATGRRVNASLVAPTKMERELRELFDRVDGWSVFGQITVPFTGPLDIQSILDAHRDKDYRLDNDVIYLVNVDRKSPKFGQVEYLDVGNGNYPALLEKTEYWDHDPRGWTSTLGFEEADEDTNKNGKLDEGEDTDADGILDKPNYLPGANPSRDDYGARADAMMTFYERETDTLIVRPMEPLDERTTYAVVVSKKLLDADGEPVGSPFPFVNDASQTQALKPLLEVLPPGLSKDEIAFAFTFTTQTVQSNWIALRDGLYGSGVQSHLSTEFPAELSGLEDVRDIERNPSIKNRKVMYTENWFYKLEDIYNDIFEQDTDGREFIALKSAHKYIDYHVIGSFESPQLFERFLPDGKTWRRYNEQSWPEDLDRKPAAARGERVYFWLTIPRKEISARGQGKHAPLVMLGHGYSSSRVELLPFAGHFAKHGLATISIDCVSHGVGVSDLIIKAARNIFEDAGLAPFLDAALKDRAEDLNEDLQRDSGADFWTSYIFHTRDVVRQSALDYMQLTRIIKSFDGEKKWGDWARNASCSDKQFETKEKCVAAEHTWAEAAGEPFTAGIAGDFDGDGVVDVGADSVITMTGGSLGGIMSLIMSGIEPNVSASAPIAGGGGLSDIALRSRQGGVREAVILRMLAPIYLGSIDSTTGTLKVETLVTDLNSSKIPDPIGFVKNAKAGDTVVVKNIETDESACGYISQEGTFRVGIASDEGDRHEISFYDGPSLVLGNTECEVKEKKEPYQTINKFERDVYFQAKYWDADSDLVALQDGLGLRRANPEMRRFMSFAQVALDGADPAILSRFAMRDPITYPATDQTTGSHMLVVTTSGDMNVPASSGLSIGRAAGLLEYIETDSRLGMSPNQALIESYMSEAVHTTNRFTFSDDPTASRGGVHMDVENYSQNTDRWAIWTRTSSMTWSSTVTLNPTYGVETNIPRQTKIRAGLVNMDGTERKDKLGGWSGAIFPYTVPDGQHGFAFPGQDVDSHIKRCKRDCADDATCKASCEDLDGKTFDVGFFMFNMMGRYLRSGGMELDDRLCHAHSNCTDAMGEPHIKPPPPVRDEADLR